MRGQEEQDGVSNVPGSPRRRTGSSRLKPERFGRYVLLDRIDVGGMAEVFRGRMGGVEGFERMVALKRILPNIAADPDFVEMFVDEAKLAVQFQHANIAQIYELGKVNDSHFIAMEYVSGVSLRTMWDRARGRNRLLPIAMSCHVMQKVCEGLDAAHRKKDERTGEDLSLVHRDVSPQNVLVSFEGEVKVIDFGIAKAANKVSKTQAGVLKGKFGYMSPEQVRGIELDNRSDIFACGVVLYELLVGDRLFLGESDFSTLEKIRNVEMVPPTRLNKNLSPHLERIVMKALSKSREDRYRWAAEMAEDLQRYLFATNQPFARTDLQRYMQQHFRGEMEEEKARLAHYREVRLEEEPAPERAPSASEPLTEVGVGALAGPAGGFGALPVRTDPSGDVPNVSAVHERDPLAPDTALIDGALPVSPLPPRLPTWAAMVIGVLTTLLLVGAGGVILWSQGLLGAPGSISVQFEPEDASVYLDDRLVAKGSPVTLEGLPKGPHVLTVRRDGYEEAVRPVAVVPGEDRMVSIRLNARRTSAGIRVKSRPSGLLIHLDGQSTGRTTPASFKGLTVGPHKLSLYAQTGELVYRIPLSLEADEVRPVDVDVAELPPVLDVDSEPSGAMVRVNGRLRGTTPVTVAGLEPGPVRVDIRKEGCQSQRRMKTVARGSIVSVSAKLKCRSGETR